MLNFSIVLPLRDRFIFTTNFIPGLINGMNHSSCRHELILVLDKTGPIPVKLWINDHKNFLDKYFKLKVIEIDELGPTATRRNKWVNATKIGLNYASNEFVFAHTCEHMVLTKNWDIIMSEYLQSYPDRAIVFPTICPSHPSCKHFAEINYEISVQNREKMRKPVRTSFCFPIGNISLGIDPLSFDDIMVGLSRLINNDLISEHFHHLNYGGWTSYFIRKDILQGSMNVIPGSTDNDLAINTHLGYRNIYKLITWRGLGIHVNYPVRINIQDKECLEQYKPIYDFTNSNICDSW